jgi:transposase
MVQNNETPKQRKRRERNEKIKTYYLGLPLGLRSIRKVASIFDVSRSTVLYAVNGRPGKNGRK